MVALEQVALLYDEPEPPVLLAFAEEPAGGMAALLRSLAGDLPHEVYAHLSPGLLDALASELVPARDPAPHLKLGLVDPGALTRHDTAECELLSSADLEEVERFYDRAYPGTWFQPRMLETGRYVGIRRERRACVRRRRARLVAGVARCVSRQRRDRAGGSRRGARDRRMREALPRPPRGRDRRDLAQRPRRQRRSDPRPTRSSDSRMRPTTSK